MYRCEHTGENIGPCIPLFRVVLERRSVTYRKPIKKRKQIIDWVDVQGWEIAKEIRVGPKAYEELTGEKAEFIPVVQEKKPAFKKPYRQRESERYRAQQDRRRNTPSNRKDGVYNRTSSRPQNRSVDVQGKDSKNTRR